MNESSAQLAKEGIEALRGLLSGIAHEDPTRDREVAPTALSDGLVATILRLFFLQIAESRGLLHWLPRATDWPSLLHLFRKIHEAHQGSLFDPDAHPLLEAMRISNGALQRVLQTLNGSTRALEIEQLGSMYEALLDVSVQRDEGDHALRLQPNSERRRSGAHYTPRTLTASIVRTTLRPIFEALGEHPTAAQLLELRICDPAMGSGAFLLEACRQLADALVAAWAHHGDAPKLQSDAARITRARQLVAQHCLYGVDKNPVAVDLARLSLWLVARAEDQPFTFVDHAVKCGDSLVGFAWQRAFPQVFARANPGFDALVGNPPFLGGTNISSRLSRKYLDALYAAYPDTGDRTDLCVYFFRRAFTLCRKLGTIGFIATNTIAQGDSRSSGLAWICRHGGSIYEARRRLRWPGRASVVVSIVHIRKGPHPGSAMLDGRAVPLITAHLFHRGSHDEPKRLAHNVGRSWKGIEIGGQGFLFDDADERATSLAEMRRLLASNPRNRQIVRGYIGGAELNNSHTMTSSRHVIDFAQRSLEEARDWPALLRILEQKVLPDRARRKSAIAQAPWWRFWRVRSELTAAIAGLPRVLVIARVSNAFAFAFLPNGLVYSEQLIVFALPQNAALCILQSRLHEVWVRFFGSSLGDGLRYTPSDCFETFPFPADWQQNAALEAAGAAYDALRSAIMDHNRQGLTETYKRFHDPDDHDARIEELRALHEAMDRAALDAYGFGDIPTACEFRATHEAESHGARRKPSHRLRWPAAVHDEVLARLLERNQQQSRK